MITQRWVTPTKVLTCWTGAYRAPSNAGHDYGTDLTQAQKRDLIEYLKTL